MMNTNNHSFPKTGVLWSAVLTLVLSAMTSLADTNQPAAKEKERSIVAVFRLEGELTEVPADDSFAMFGSPADSLKDLVARLTQAAHDSAVKAVVLLPDAATLGLGQVEELRAAVSLIRSHNKEVYVHADSLMTG